MPRPSLNDPPKEIKISLPSSLVAKMELLLYDPMRQKPLYGSRSSLVRQLLERWVEEQEGE